MASTLPDEGAETDLKPFAIPRSVGELLLDAVPQLSDRLAEVRLRRSWEAAVGPEIARRTRPAALSEGCLTVVVDNSPWLHELSLRQSELLARIRARCASVRTLRLTIGSLAVDGGTAGTGEVPPPPALSEQDQREIEEAAAVISDTALAASARRLLTRAWQAAGASGSRR
jgi:hypothetical protein